MLPLNALYSENAIADLENIFLWVFEASLDPYVADKFVQRIRAKCDSISLFPQSGRSRDDLFIGLRTIAFERKAVIAYVEKYGRIEITNVFYGGRDFEAIYAGSDTSETFE